VLHISILGSCSFFGGLSPPNPRGDGTGYQQTSISKTVWPNHASWDIGLLDAQQWLQHLTLDGISLNKFIQYTHCRAIQPFRLTLFLIKAWTTVIS